MIIQQIDSDLKQAMLAGDKAKVSVLRGLKSAMQYAQVAKDGNEDLSETELQSVLSKEAKKRIEAAELYQKNGDEQRANAELSEKSVIDIYLPKQLDESQVEKLVDKAISDLGATDMKSMGKVIAQVRNEAGSSADGAIVAQLVKARLQGN